MIVSRQRIVALGCAAAPGLVLAVQVAGLLFFLNPHLEFSPTALARVVVTLAPTVVLGSVIVHLPVVIARPQLARRVVPWSLTLVLAAAAVLDGLHASLLAYYLPAGINVRLIKTALWMTLGTTLGLFTALLHTLDDRRYGVKSRLLLWTLAIGSVLVIVERREAYDPTTETTLASAVVRPASLQLVVVGIDGASLDAVLPLAERGVLPFFAELVREGSYARLAPLTPARTAPGWSTVMTGRQPHEHGVVDDVVRPAPGLGPGAALRQRPLFIGFDRWGSFGRPVRHLDRGDRRSSTWWEILVRLGRTVGVVGWPTSNPIEVPGSSFVLSDRIFAGTISPSLAAPPDLALSTELFEPETSEIELSSSQLGSVTPASIAGLKQDIWRSEITSFLSGQRDVDAIFLRLPGLRDLAIRHWSPLDAAPVDGLVDPTARDATQPIRAYYRYLDSILAQLWRDVDSGPKLMVVVSAHGVSGRSGWGSLLPRATPGVVDRDADGLLLIRGEGVRRGAVVPGVSLVDVMPTALYALGLPVGRDLDGKVVTDLFEQAWLDSRPMTFVSSFETLSLDPGLGD